MKKRSNTFTFLNRKFSLGKNIINLNCYCKQVHCRYYIKKKPRLHIHGKRMENHYIQIQMISLEIALYGERD